MAEAPPPDGSRKPGGLDLQQFAIDQAEARADKAIQAGLAGWWARADDNQKLAWKGLAAAAALGPLGQGLLAAAGILFAAAAIPTTDQLTAVVWLFLIAAPVALWCFTMGAFLGTGSFATAAVVAGAASYVGGALLAGGGVPAQLGDLYCFAAFTPTGIEYEHACRAFDALGFLHNARPYIGSVSGSAKVAEWALVYTADARGTAMATAAVIGGFSAGYLARRATE
jgi:hypothetical protein